MNIAIGVVAHPSRREHVENLTDTVAFNVACYDTHGRGERWNHAETLRELLDTVPRADWYVLIEDDALPCADFRDRLAAALDQAGDDVLVSLYLGQGAWATRKPDTKHTVARLVRQADLTGGWIDADEMWHAVGVCIRAEHARSVQAHLATESAPTDLALTRWAAAHEVGIRYTYPSLVDHADGASVIPRTTPRKAGRVAWRFADEHAGLR